MNVRSSRARALATLTVAPLALAFSSPSQAQTAAEVRVATDPFDSYAEPYYAQDMGFFTKAGLDVQVISFASGAAISLAVTGGAADIGISNPTQLANAISHGIPLTLIAGGGLYSTKAPNMLLCVAKNSPLQNPKDFDGKTIAVSALKDITQLAAKAWLAQGGAANARVQFVELPFTEMGAAVQRGTIDAALIVEPALEAALGRGDVRSIAKPFDAIAPEFLIGAWFTTTAFAAKSPEIVKKFVATIYQTARWANANQNASGQILGKYSKMLPETMRRMTRVLYSESLTPRLIQPILDISYKNGILDKPITASQMIARS